MAKILVIEDDRDINDILFSLLTNAGYDVLRAYDGKEAEDKITVSPDLILMDLMLPDTTGEQLLMKVPHGTPVIAVSARSQISDKVDLLTRGCVDYITKPFDHKELLARIEVALRFKRNDVKVSYANLTLHDDVHKIRIDNEAVRLTPTEYAILKVLILNSDRVISRSELLDKAQEDTPDLVEDSLKVHMSNLRKKLKNAGSTAEIEAVWGIGFKLNHILTMP